MTRSAFFLRRSVAAAFALLGTVLCSSSHATQFTWDPVEAVDDSVDIVSGSSGVSVLFANDRWNVVYEKNGEIVHAARTDMGWLEPEPLTHDHWYSWNPHIALGAGSLHVVWQDNRSGHQEVWTRRQDTNGWSAEECLSCDALPSHDPVITGFPNRAFVAWEEDSASIHMIRGRFFDTIWQPTETVTQSSANATEPTVSSTAYGPIVMAWSDTRHGTPEIYERNWNPYPGVWEAEQRLTTLGDCTHPSIHAEYCCLDILQPVWLVAFEHPAKATEIYTLHLDQASPVLLSPDDGIPSVAPNADGFAFVEYSNFGGPVPQYFVTWTDDFVGIHTLDFNIHQGRWTLSQAGLSRSVVGAIEGNPEAGVMAAWVEDREGVPTLLSRTGHLPGVSTGVGPPLFGPEFGLSVTPNPSPGNAVLRLRLPEQSDVRLRIVDVSGRVVHEWQSRAQAPGEWPIEWNGRDESGHATPPGLYFVSVRAGSREITRSFVMLR